MPTYNYNSLSDRPLFYIYGLYSNKCPEIIRYIGKSNNVKLRLYHHIAKANKKVTSIKDSWIKSVITSGESINYTILDVFDDEDLCYMAEEVYVDYFRKLIGNKLTNGISGGRGTKSPTDEVRQKLINSHLGKPNKNKGKKLSKERIEKARLAYYRRKERGEVLTIGKKHNENTKNKLREIALIRHREKEVSEETRLRLSKSVKLSWDSGKLNNRKKKVA